jgi:hypothetical protein
VLILRPGVFQRFNNTRDRDFSTASVPPATLPCIEASTAARRVGLPPLAK